MTNAMPVTKLLFTGIDGSNPLAFMAALGTFRIATALYKGNEVSLAWLKRDGGWKPELKIAGVIKEEKQFCGELDAYLGDPPQLNLFQPTGIGDNLTISPDRFRNLALQYLELDSNNDSQYAALDFLAALGTDATYQPHAKDRRLMQDTALRTMAGAGHQHFVKFMREIISNTDASHLYSSLFQNWMYEDEGRGMNMRWDPIDDRRYSMRWKNPSSDPATMMRGANRLAIEALPLFPTAPVGNQLQTTGFRIQKGAFWSWPIWDAHINLAVTQSVLQTAWITEGSKSVSFGNSSDVGIVDIFRCQRITVGKFRNFTPAKSI